MLGLLVELAISWLLLWLFERKHLNALGFDITIHRIKAFAIGFLLAALWCCLYYLSIAFLTRSNFSFNPSFTTAQFTSSSWWVMKSVLFEEFIFRGAILYILIVRVGEWKACLISAASFGVYHIFSYGLSNPVQIIFVSCSTAVWGWMFAIAFTRSRTLYLPIALHFGYNFVHTVIFSQGPLGNQWLVMNDPHKLTELYSLLFFLLNTFVVPVIVFFYLRKAPGRPIPDA